jgi:diaminohydroxyphosphoribosylaminopyrimidine deaminase/5-amino-6-(5-phosphoribosylamino)uracil reductase
MARDASLLARAFQEAERAGWLLTAPNPRVGALALLDGHVVGHGHHAACGLAHAEEAALRDAGAWDEKSDRPIPGRVDEMIVSLEPCSSEGDGKRRRPCATLLLEAGVKRVVVGAGDPDPRHRGAGLAKLREAGVEVVEAREDAGFRAQNLAFLSSLAAPKRPFTVLKWAATLDGRTATRSMSSQWITGPAARAEVQRLRAVSDGVLVGPGTLAADQPRLDARTLSEDPLQRQPIRLFWGAARAATAGEGPGTVPGPRWWLESEERLPSGADGDDRCLVIAAGSLGGLDPVAAMGRLHEEGIRRILVEGGSRLQGRLLAAGMIDAVVRYEAPSLFGGGLGSLEGDGVEEPMQAWRLTAEERLDLGPDLRRAFLLDAAVEPA